MIKEDSKRLATMVTELRRRDGIKQLEDLMHRTGISLSRLKALLEDGEFEETFMMSPVYVQCVLSTEHYRRLQRLAKTKGMTVSCYVGQVVSSLMDAVSEPADLVDGL